MLIDVVFVVFGSNLNTTVYISSICVVIALAFFLYTFLAFDSQGVVLGDQAALVTSFLTISFTPSIFTISTTSPEATGAPFSL